jgi:uncharacterized membrane protein YphA (DoxX/SURF4 family)
VALAYIHAAGLPLPGVAHALSIAIEVGCGLLLILGFRTRAAALILTGFCMVTAASFHTNFADQTMRRHLRPLGVRQNEYFHQKLESHKASKGNPDSQQILNY